MPKSPIFRVKSSLTIRFPDLRSRCTIVGFHSCSDCTPSAHCRSSDRASGHDKPGDKCRSFSTSYSDPRAQYSNTSMTVGSVTAPKKNTVCGDRRLDMMEHSCAKAALCSSTMVALITLTATVCPRKVPAYTSAVVPSLNFSASNTSDPCTAHESGSPSALPDRVTLEAEAAAAAAAAADCLRCCADASRSCRSATRRRCASRSATTRRCCSLAAVSVTAVSRCRNCLISSRSSSAVRTVDSLVSRSRCGANRLFGLASDDAADDAAAAAAAA
mmetsp:Transcript_2195/g.6939  ORF Transcript_2195/g.6939 Transcript_2195/m.6939 type:complete len:273 (+) Transcript_2195:632-1450(+)